MTLNEMIAILQEEIDANPEIGEHQMAMAGDPEGNHFNLMSDNFYSTGKFAKERHRGEYYSEEDIEDMDEEDKAKLIDVVVLWP